MNTAGFGVLSASRYSGRTICGCRSGIHFGWNATLPFLGVVPEADLQLELRSYVAGMESRRSLEAVECLRAGKASLPASFVLLVLFAVVWKMPVRKGAASLLDSSVLDSNEA